MKRKVVFLTSIPMIKQHRIDMHVDAIAEICDIELWDLGLIYGNTEVMRGIEKDSLRINSLKEFQKKLYELSNLYNVIIVTNILRPYLKPIYSIIHSKHIPIVNINKDSFPAWLFDAAVVHNKSKVRFLPFMKAVVRYIPFTRKLYSLLVNGRVKYDYQLASYNFYPEDSHHFIKIHNVKYDEFINAQNQAPVIPGDYILFIDAALADHPMFRNASRKINREKYLDQLNSYFTKLEQKYNVPVVISAHPKSNYSNDDFAGRQIILYKTPELIRFAKFVVSHYSTSLFDVILQKKPFKVLYSSELIKSTCYSTVLSGMQLANLVKVESVSIDNPILNDFCFDEKAYNTFINKFILNKKKLDVTNKELIQQFIKHLN